jgi:hypothetical protein
MEAAESFEVFQPAIVLAVSLCRLGGPVKGHIIANNKRPMAQPNRSSSIHQWPPISPHFLFLDSLTCTAHVWLPKWPKNIFIYGQLVACLCVRSPTPSCAAIFTCHNNNNSSWSLPPGGALT